MANLDRRIKRTLDHSGKSGAKRSIISRQFNSFSHGSRRYNEGSVYIQASRFNPYLSSSTNMSTSLSGSVEIIVSDLDTKFDSQSKTEKSQVRENKVELSDEREAARIKEFTMDYKNFKSAFTFQEESVKSTIKELQIMQLWEKKDREKNLYLLRKEVLKAFNNYK